MTGGAEGEVLHLLDSTPYSDAPSRAVFPAGAIAADRDRLASRQQPDGGWEVTYASFSPAGSLEWRGYTTVQSVTVLRRPPMTGLPWGPHAMRQTRQPARRRTARLPENRAMNWNDSQHSVLGVKGSRVQIPLSRL